jgi:hypothetical protein
MIIRISHCSKHTWNDSDELSIFKDNLQDEKIELMTRICGFFHLVEPNKENI